MQALKNLTSLSEKVSIYVPATMNVLENIDNSEHVDHVGKQLSKLFGGYTVQEVSGGWVSENGELVKENTTIVYAYAQELGNEELEQIIKLCEFLKFDMKQEAVSLEVNNKLYFI